MRGLTGLTDARNLRNSHERVKCQRAHSHLDNPLNKSHQNERMQSPVDIVPAVLKSALKNSAGLQRTAVARINITPEASFQMRKYVANLRRCVVPCN